MINAGFAGLIMWVTGAILGGGKQIKATGVSANGLLLKENERIAVAFSGSQLSISY